MTNDPPDAPERRPRSSSLGEFFRRNPATVALLLACGLVAFWTRLGDSLETVRWLTFVELFPEAGSGDRFPGLAEGQAWRLLTPILIHFGIIHLVFNLMWLYDLGGMIEGRWRTRHFACLVAIVAVVSNATQFAVNWDFANGIRFGNALSGGMSGVVYGLFGYLWIRGRLDPSLGLRLDPQTVVLMLGWLVFCMTGLMGHVGNTAHLVGLLVGVGAGFAAARLARPVA